MGNDVKNVWRREKMIIVSIFSLLFLACLNEAQSQVKRSKIVLHEKKCDAPRGCKECTVATFTCDSNVFIRKKEGRYATLRSDAEKECFAVDLFIYKRVISLDSMYYSTIQNKELQYIGGFIKGMYSKKGNEISLSLTFLNAAINSSTPTDHTFLINYNLIKNTIDYIEMKL